MLDRNVSFLSPAVGFCEDSSEPSGSVKNREKS
jgi:hypothetical protein